MSTPAGPDTATDGLPDNVPDDGPDAAHDRAEQAAGPPVLRLRVPGGVLKVERRTAVVTLALFVGTLALALFALTLGDSSLSLGEVLRQLFSVDDGLNIVRDWRLPRVLAAVTFGAALAVSGALFQSLTRNPLGSPDIIGFSTGAYTGALIVLTVVGTGVASAAVGALIGGIGTAIVVYLLAWRQGIQGFRLIVVGIAVTAMLGALNTWLQLRTDADVALAAAIWGAGSISLIEWADLVPVLIALVVLFPLVGMLAGTLRELELGDDAARAHGVRTEPGRIAILLVGVALTAVVTAAAGPIVFVALAAPQIAARLTRGAGLPLAASAFAGSILLLSADLLAQHVLPDLFGGGSPRGVPVGVVTVVIGGIYLLWLLVHEVRRRRR